MHITKLKKIGGSVGLILPLEVLARLKLKAGDTVYLIDAPEGVTIASRDSVYEEQLELGREIMREYRTTLEALSK